MAAMMPSRISKSRRSQPAILRIGDQAAADQQVAAMSRSLDAELFRQRPRQAEQSCVGAGPPISDSPTDSR